MADNVTLPGTGTSIRAKNLGGELTQLMGLDIGGEGAEIQVSAANPMPTSTYDGAGNAINSLSAGAGQNALLSATGPTSFVYSTLNSSNVQLASGASFVGGVESTTAQPSASVLLTSDNRGLLVINQFEDAAGTLLVSQWTYPTASYVPFSRSFVINGNYLQFIYTNTDADSTTIFNLNVAYGAIPSATNLGNAPTSINEINGVAIPQGVGSIPVNVVSSGAVADPATLAAQTPDAPLFHAITGDPSGDYANVDFMAALFDSSLGYTANVNVTNQPATDPLSANNGALAADCKGFQLFSGQTIIIDTQGYQSVVIQSQAGAVTVAQSNINSPNQFQFIYSGIASWSYSTTYIASSGASAIFTPTLRYMKLAMAVAPGNFAQIYLRNTPATVPINSYWGTSVSIGAITGMVTEAVLLHIVVTTTRYVEVLEGATTIERLVERLLHS